MSEAPNRIAELEAQIAELKARWPAHSLQPWMLQQLEDLEDELEQLRLKRPSTEDEKIDSG